MEPKVQKAFAEQLINNELLWKTLDEIQQDQVSVWLSSTGVNEVQEREECHRVAMASKSLAQILRNKFTALSRG